VNELLLSAHKYVDTGWHGIASCSAVGYYLSTVPHSISKGAIKQMPERHL